jgi:hypothetical protein
MRRISTLATAAGTAAILALAGSIVGAQVTATAVLKNGDRHTGSNLAYRVDGRQVIVRTSQADEPRIPVDQVAYVDFGGTPDPPNLNLSGSQEAVVLRDGSVVKGQILELGHTNKADLSSPFLVIVRTEGGEERRLQSNQVSRVYFGGGQSSSGSSGGSATTPPDSSGGLTVPATQAWTQTGFVVRRGEPLTFEVSGEIRIGGPGTTANAGGSSDMNSGNPLPNVGTGALIGRIGNSAPFLIGNQGRIQAPAAGQLFLGVNDSNHGDNSGEFRVTVRRIARSR